MQILSYEWRMTGSGMDDNELRSKLEPLDPELVEYLHDTNLFHPLLYELSVDRDRAARTNRLYRNKVIGLNRAKEERDWDTCVWLHERPYRLDAFIDIGGNMTDQQYWQLLCLVWVDSENIRQNADRWRELWNSSRPAKLTAMTERERGALAEMPAEFVIYRGFSDGFYQGMSWTIDRSKAIGFARRHGAKPGLATARAKRENVHAFFDEHEEREIVIDRFDILDCQDVDPSES
jgi:hypothetical protein